ncbi:unnamed protein product [Brassicogethes aeneus]|uniref:Partial AB-hydrolase lipase domain-containing protein n=1 Tax=Brassicogethes aeneus TaxID=1431903 RepID=A0A9P0B243_BRAAE|nr:unnamed protein product [Brassicogethes aeneus]
MLVNVASLYVLLLLLKNSHCNKDPDVHDPIETIINRYGYQMQNITVQTDDGYILQTFRISPNGTNIEKISGQPLVIWHACDRNARSLVANGKESLPFYYVDSGYDVWLPNIRGTKYSSHVSLTQKDAKYWNFSYGKIGRSDVKAVSEMIVQKTGKKLITMGHSLTTSALFVYASELPEEASKNIKGIIGLAPAINVYYSWAFKLPSLLPNTIRDTFGVFGMHYIDTGFASICELKIAQPLCEFLVDFSFGKGDNIDVGASYARFFSKENNEPISSQVLINYLQMMHSKGTFAEYDFGMLRNLKEYGKLTPPEFNIKNINVRTDLVCGTDDKVVSCKDSNNTYKMLQSEKSLTMLPNNDKCKGSVAHYDYYMNTDMKNCIFDPVDEILKNYKSL